MGGALQSLGYDRFKLVSQQIYYGQRLRAGLGHYSSGLFGEEAVDEVVGRNWRPAADILHDLISCYLPNVSRYSSSSSSSRSNNSKSCRSNRNRNSNINIGGTICSTARVAAQYGNTDMLWSASDKDYQKPPTFLRACHRGRAHFDVHAAVDAFDENLK